MSQYSKYVTRPDTWWDLIHDFGCGPGGCGLLWDDVSIDAVADRARGSLAYMPVSYAELITDRALVAGQAAVWRAMLLPDVIGICPAVDAELRLELGLASVSPADCPDVWQGFTAPYRRAADIVVVPPVVGWEASAEVFADVQHALGQGIPVYLLAEGEA